MGRADYCRPGGRPEPEDRACGLPEEDAHAARPGVMLSEGFWRNRYHGDSPVLGRAVRIDAGEFTICGG